MQAMAVGREPDFQNVAADVSPLHPNGPQNVALDSRAVGADSPRLLQFEALLRAGTVAVDGQTVRFIRPGVTEEYSVSMDGIRQDFVVVERPAAQSLNTVNPEAAGVSALHLNNGENQSRLTSAAKGEGELRVELTVTGARVEKIAYGARLVLEHSGRKIAYSRLHVTDANGRELPARIEVLSGAAEVTRLKSNAEHGPRDMETSQSLLTSAATDAKLAVLVNDADAVYPIRIDPTFSDENWISMGGLPGTDGTVNAVAADGAGNLYIGGSFTVAGDVFANNVAKWDGDSWSALGSGVNDTVRALAVSDNILYVGGSFSLASFSTSGGLVVNGIAEWDGANWFPLDWCRLRFWLLQRVRRGVCARLGGHRFYAGDFH